MWPTPKPTACMRPAGRPLAQRHGLSNDTRVCCMMDGSVKIQQLLAFPPFVETNRNSKRTCFLIGACLPLKRNLPEYSVTAEYGKYGLFDSTDDLRKSKRMQHMLHLWNRLFHETLQFLVKLEQKTSATNYIAPHIAPPQPPPSRRTPDARRLHRPARVSIQGPLLKWP